MLFCVFKTTTSNARNEFSMCWISWHFKREKKKVNTRKHGSCKRNEIPDSFVIYLLSVKSSKARKSFDSPCGEKDNGTKAEDSNDIKSLLKQFGFCSQPKKLEFVAAAVATNEEKTRIKSHFSHD